MIPGLGLLSGVWLKVAMAAVVAALLAGAVWHYMSLRSERDEYLVQMQLERSSHLQTKSSFKAYVEEAERRQAQITRSMAVLAKATTEAAKDNKALVEKLSKHNLEELSARKPGLLERRVNEATEAMRSQLEGLSQ